MDTSMMVMKCCHMDLTWILEITTFFHHHRVSPFSILCHANSSNGRALWTNICSIKEYFLLKNFPSAQCSDALHIFFWGVWHMSIISSFMKILQIFSLFVWMKCTKFTLRGEKSLQLKIPKKINSRKKISFKSLMLDINMYEGIIDMYSFGFSFFMSYNSNGLCDMSLICVDFHH